MHGYTFLSMQFLLMISRIMASAPSSMRLQTLLSIIFIDSIRSLGDSTGILSGLESLVLESGVRA